MWRKWLLHIGLLIICCWQGLVPGQSLRFEEIGTETAWGQYAFNDILQDRQGFLWLATWTGLIRFDGIQSKVYRQSPDSPKGLQGNKITCLFEDSQGRLWIGSSFSGFYQYIPELDQFIQYAHQRDNPNSLSNNNVWAILEDQFGYLWIGTENGLNQLNLETGRFRHFGKANATQDGLSHEFVYALTEDQQGNIWIGTEEGLNRLVQLDSGRSHHFFHYDLAPTGLSPDDYLRHNFTESLCLSQELDHTLWVGTSIGVTRLSYSDDPSAGIRDIVHLGKGPEGQGLSHQFVSDVFESPDGRLWIATYQGLDVLDISSGQLTTYLGGNPEGNSGSAIVRSLFSDRFGGIWAGMGNGLLRAQMRPAPFSLIPLAEIENQLSAIKASQSYPGFWLTSRGGGLSYLDPYKGFSQHWELLPPQVPALAGFVSDLLIDQSGDMWISTQGAGLLKIPERDIALEGPTTISSMRQFTKETVLSDDYIMSLLESQNGQIWVGYWDKGLDRYDPASDSFFHTQFSSDLKINLSAFPVIALAETHQHDSLFLWVGTRGDGIYQMHYEPDNQHLSLIRHYQYTPSDSLSLSNNFVNVFYPDPQGYVWAGTENGINRIHPATGRIQYFLESDGLSHPNLQSISQDSSGSIWVSTLDGLNRLVEKNDTFSIQSFKDFHGLNDKLFRSNSAHTLSDGRVMMGSASGITLVHPSLIHTDTLAPEVILTDLKINNQAVSVGAAAGPFQLRKAINYIDTLELSYTDNVLSFSFVGIHFQQPQRVTYAYRLKGFDDEWIYTNGDNRIAHYTNLPYASFQFEVKAQNGDGAWSNPVQVFISIAPPIWQSSWAYMLYILGVLGIIWIIFRVYKIRTELHHSLQLERIERQKLQEVNEVKLRFFTNISHELRTPLTLIISPLEELIRQRKGDKPLHQSYARMHRNASRLLTMINQLLDIRKSEAGLLNLKVGEGDVIKFVGEIILAFQGLANQKNINLQFVPTASALSLWYDRDQMEKVFYNLLANAFKFTPSGGNIHIDASLTPDQTSWRFSIADTGPGIPPDQIPHIFERFYQADRSKSQPGEGGTGIGLALAKNIVSAHGGTIKVKSEWQKGATFIVELPLGADHFEETQIIPDFENSESISHYVVPDISEEGLQLPNPAQLAAASPERSRILVVEDNLEIRAYLKESLEATYEILEAENGAEGLQAAFNHAPDLVLADISMPIMDGITMCAKLKSSVLTSHIPVLLLTARTSLIYKIDGFENGADDYVTKPFNMKLLQLRISNLIESRNRLRLKLGASEDLQSKEHALPSLDESFLEHVHDRIDQQLDDPQLTVELLASHVNMSRMQLYRKLKALTGLSPNQIIRNYRLRRATELLKTGQYNVSEITYMVGYNDLKSFREQFKKKYGLSPSHYTNG